MNNGNMPAMPLNDIEIWIDPTDQSKGTIDATGLTKREHFAGLAMQGFIAAGFSSMPSAIELSDMAVNYADELLKELDK